MERRGCQNKGDKAPRRSPRRQKKTCGRPFTAPRTGKLPKTALKGKTSAAQLVQEDGLDTQDSQVKQITETENDRDIQERTAEEAHVIPFIPGIRLMSEREADEVARHGEVLRWSSDEDGNNTPKTTLGSDTTDSTPEFLKSPVQSEGRVPGEIVKDKIRAYVITASPTSLTYDGPSFIPETERQESSSDRPVVRSLRNRQNVEEEGYCCVYCVIVVVPSLMPSIGIL